MFEHSWQFESKNPIWDSTFGGKDWHFLNLMAWMWSSMPNINYLPIFCLSTDLIATNFLAIIIISNVGLIREMRFNVSLKAQLWQMNFYFDGYYEFVCLKTSLFYDLTHRHWCLCSECSADHSSKIALPSSLHQYLVFFLHQLNRQIHTSNLNCWQLYMKVSSHPSFLLYLSSGLQFMINAHGHNLSSSYLLPFLQSRLCFLNCNFISVGFLHLFKLTQWIIYLNGDRRA